MGLEAVSPARRRGGGRRVQGRSWESDGERGSQVAAVVGF
jgi:hypothetical protein